MAKSAKAKLHGMLLRHGLSVPTYERITAQKANIFQHTVVASITIGRQTYTGEGSGE